MKSIIAISFFALCGLAHCKPQNGEKYTTKYDNIDLDGVLKNDRLLRNYLDCALGTKTACTKDAEELKNHLPEALQNNCAKCSEAQKNGSKKVIKYLVKNKREWWNELETKFDPQGTYKARYADEFKKEGIVF